MTPEEMQAEMERLKGLGAFPQAPQQQAAQPPQGLLARMGAGIQKFRNDPEKMARLTMGLNSMRLNPDQGIAASAANTIQLAQERRQNTIDAAGTVKFLQGRATADPMAAKALAAIQANPSMVKDIMGAYLSGQFKSPHMSKNIGSVQTAQEDMPFHGIKAGDQFTYHLDPNATGGYTLIKLGGRGITEQEKAKIDQDAALRESDIQEARTQAKEYFDKYGSVSDQIRSLRQARQLIEDGAATGFVRQYLPAFDANTQALRTVANQMGIDIINSATFGALSATELRLALSTGFPQGLSESETLKYIDQKIAAQDKFRRELLKKTNRLNSGIGFTQWTSEVLEQEQAEAAVANPPMNSQKLMDKAAKNNVSVQYIWDRMNYAQRKAFMDEEQK